MRNWKIGGIEPSLDELLGDEVMVPIMRTAGLSADDIRALVAETAARFDGDSEIGLRVGLRRAAVG